VVCRPVAKQRPRNEQLDNNRVTVFSVWSVPSEELRISQLVRELSRDGVAIDGFWVSNLIYWTL
jgi:hypothetical protein